MAVLLEKETIEKEEFEAIVGEKVKAEDKKESSSAEVPERKEKNEEAVKA